MKLRAYCPTCKRFVTDELDETGTGVTNTHEHDVRLMNELATLKPKQSLEGVIELTPSAYLNEVSKVDADLIVERIQRVYNIPFLPPHILRKLVEEVLKIARSIVVEDRKAPKGKKGTGNGR